MADTYTHTRIRKAYLDKLQALAVRHKRSAMRELEVLIDAASYTASPKPHEITWSAFGASCSCGLLFVGRSNAAKHAREANGAQPPIDQGELELGGILKKHLDADGKGDMAMLGGLGYDLMEWCARERKAATKEARQQALTDFAEFCHERYLGCGQNNSSPTGLDYSYSGEVVTMAEAYLDHTTPNQQETKHE